MAVLVKTDSELEKKTDENDKKKLKFEKPLIRKLNALFTTISKEWSKLYAATGMSIDMDQYQREMEVILRDGYRDSESWFLYDFQRSIEESLEDAETEDDIAHYNLMLEIRELIEPALLLIASEYILTHSQEQSAIILSTTQDIVNKHVANTISDIAEETGVFPSNRQVSKVAGVKILEENRNRSSLIAETEIQNSSETFKWNEADQFDLELQSREVTPTPSLFLEKMWKTVGDTHVRASHILANGQQRRIRETYVVQGEMLMHPGDTSMGATASNTMRCRCSSITL